MDPRELPDKHVRARYEMNRSTHAHPELRTADHIFVSEMVKNANGGLSAQRPADPGLDLQAKALAEEINEGLKVRPVSNRDVSLPGPTSKEVAEGLGLKVHAQRLPGSLWLTGKCHGVHRESFRVETQKPLSRPFQRVLAIISCG